MGRRKLPTSEGPFLDNFDSFSGSASSISKSYTVGVDDGIMIVSIGTQDSNDANLPVTVCTLGGVSLTKLRHDPQTGQNDCRSEIWYMIDPPVGTATLVVGTGTSVWKAAIVSTFGNVHQTDFVDVSDGTSGSSQTPAKTVTPSYPFTVLIDALCSKAARSTLNTGQISLGNVQGQSFQNLSASYRIVVGLDPIVEGAGLTSSTEWNQTVGIFKSNTPLEATRRLVDPRRLIVGGRRKLTVGQ
jgi:hypothetical protein